MSQPTILREQIISLLRDEGHGTVSVDKALAAKGLPALTAEEKATFPILNVQDILGSKADPAASKAEEDAIVTAKADATPVPASKLKTKPIASQNGAWPLPNTPYEVGGKFAVPVAGSSYIMAQVVGNDFCHKAVDFCKTMLGPKWYADYRALKYPGGVESLATTETKLKAYCFAFETLLKLKLSGDA